MHEERMHGDYMENEDANTKNEGEEREKMRKRFRSPAQKQAARDAGEDEGEESSQENAGQDKGEGYDTAGERDAGKSKVERGFAIPEDQHPFLAELSVGDHAMIDAEVVAAIESKGMGRQVAFKIRDVRAD